MALSLEPRGLTAAARWCRDEDWESFLFEELIGSDDERQALKSSLYDVDMYNNELNLDFMSWDFDTWNQTSLTLSPDEQVTSEPSSPASLGCLVPSPSLDPTLTPHEEMTLSSSLFQASPASLYGESSDYSVPVSQLKVENVPQLKQKERVTASVPSNGPKQKPVHTSKPIQPKPILIPTISVSQSTKTIILQPVQTVVPGPKPPIRIYPAPTGQQVMLPQLPVVQLQPTGILSSQPAINIIGGPKHVNSVPVRVRTPTNTELNGNVAVTNLVIPTSHTGVANAKGDANAQRRQERMIKNRESACVSRRRKKEYLVNLENRLRSALAENLKLKDENGLLQKQLQELISENDQLKVTTPKRRVMCVIGLLAFIVISFGPGNIWDQDFSSMKSTGSTTSHSRHLLGFSEENAAESFKETAEKSIEKNSYRNGISFSDRKDLMVVRKEPLLFVQRACQPQVNGTESLRLADELRGWVHRHEVVRVKSRKGSRTYHKTQTGSKFPQKKTDVAQYVSVQYTDTDEKNIGNELQVYYAPDRRYPEFFETIRRRGDTFYLISFRRDHLLLPAISHNKTSKPKMSLVLPAMNIDESFINEPRDYEVMMQIDCEVTATRIIHIKSSTIPSFLRDHQQNHTDSDQHSDPTPTPITPPIITESVQGTGFKFSQ